MKKLLYHILCVLVLMIFGVSAYGQTDTIRYVSTSGSYNNDGKSWATAKDNVQDAINDLRQYLLDNNVPSGSVYVAEGTYIPSESTELGGGSMLNTSFLMYAGIHLFGGFQGTENSPEERVMANNKTWSQNFADIPEDGVPDHNDVVAMWEFKHKTVFSGNHSSLPVSFTFDSIRGKFNTIFPLNSYHVVWFATNDKIDVDNDSIADHFMPLERMAWVDGVTITGGNAASRSTAVRDHMSLGGGAYLVGNSALRNCEVKYCSAALRGGGVYLDGGGEVNHCYVHTCQALGVGIIQGYGGAVAIDYDGCVKYSYITQSSARIGGGLSISHVPSEYPWQQKTRQLYGREPVASDFVSYYAPYASACVIANNTTNAEAGGVYLNEGGFINHCTIVRNKCIGPDVTYFGRKHGRSGGIYVSDCGMVYNSVLWGSECTYNNDMQFASSQKKSDDEHQISIFHSAFMNYDITDWSNTHKDQVYNLEKSNLPTEALATGDYVCFDDPTPFAGVLCGTRSGDTFVSTYPYVNPEHYNYARAWKPWAYSTLVGKGVQVSDALQNASPWFKNAHVEEDIIGDEFEAMSAIGALVKAKLNVQFALVMPQAEEFRNGENTPIPTLFVDPNRKPNFDNEHNYVPFTTLGNSWEFPLDNIGDAIDFFKRHFVDTDLNDLHYMLNGTRYDYVQILVKEGTLTTAGQANFLGSDPRTAAIRVISHMRLYGAYPNALTGTDTDGRNPLQVVTHITANILGGSGESNYINNSSHVVCFTNTKNAIVDGFKLSDGNSYNLESTSAIPAGGGVLVSNLNTAPDKRIDMTGNQLRNCEIANCTSPKGAAIYVNGEFPKANGDISFAELNVANTVIRNNTADNLSSDLGVITANGNSFINVDHCDIVNNVGYALNVSNISNLAASSIIPNTGYIQVSNTVVYANSHQSYDDFAALTSTNVRGVNDPQNNDHIFGAYNLFDNDLTLPIGFTDGFTLPSQATVGATMGVPFTSVSHNACKLKRTDTSDPDYPVFQNPSRNIGFLFENDRPLYGGSVSYVPMNLNPCVNSANPNSIDGYDRSDTEKRNYGGAPDIGAIENTNLPKFGEVIYVTPYGAGKMDGSSWDNAIAGNAIYSVYGAPAAGTDILDTESNRITDSEGNSVLTTDDRYQGGYTKIYCTNYSTGATTETTTTYAWVSEVNKYVGGPRDGEVVPVIDNDFRETTTISTISPGSSSGWTSRWIDDDRHPYGEMSGNSRSFWRATGNRSPLSDDGVWNPDVPNANRNLNWLLQNDSLKIKNNRFENYVSGLQYAVEHASIANKTNHTNTVQVWVGVGKYTDYKGFIMRDSVAVYGGFPTAKYPTPGMEERKALMSAVVAIPKSAENKNRNPEDYETILQISEVNPKLNDSTFNEAAKFFSDDDYAIVESHDTHNYEYKIHNLTRTFDYQPTPIDVTSQHINYPTMDMSGPNGPKGNYTYGSLVNENFDNWHISFPTTQQYYIVDLSNQQNTLRVFDYETNASLGNVGSKWIRLANGSLTGAKMWQTMKNLPSGTYRLTFDGMGGYRNGDPFDITTPSNIYLHILDASGNDLADSVLFKCRDYNSPTGTNKSNIRLTAYRKTIEFTVPTTGDVTILIDVLDGTRNTTARNATYGTPNGGDPNPIPCAYAYDGNSCGTGNMWGTKNPNRRELFITNLKLSELQVAYVPTENVVDRDTIVDNPRPTVISDKRTYTSTKSRTSMRKRVLSMPDVCTPTYFSWPDPVGEGNDACAHTVRITSGDMKSRGSNTLHRDTNYVAFNEVYWNGFTIRHGFMYDISTAHGGGAGVCMFRGSHLQNCIVTDNLAGSRKQKGGGIFCEGDTLVSIENCFILNNSVTHGSQINQKQEFAGGLFLYEGTCFNTLIANNYCYGYGSVGLCVGHFYNNTVAYNIGACPVSSTIYTKDNGKKVGGVRMAVNAGNELLMANTILYGNNGLAVDISANNRTDTATIISPFINCYIQSQHKITKSQFLRAINTHVDGVSDASYGRENIFLNNSLPDATTTPFEADVVAGAYTGGAKTYNNFNLRQTDGVNCINHGTEDFETAMDICMNTPGNGINAATQRAFRNSVKGVVLPSNDVVYAPRVQDCRIDIGAYEFNGAYFIKPDTITHPGLAIFYVAHEAPLNGNASADSPENAACKQKLQLVLDAAGRYKYSLMTKEQYANVASTPVAGSPDKSWTVQVRLVGDHTGATTDLSLADTYSPTRSTKFDLQDTYADNTLDYSFIVPHGIQVLGGYTNSFYHYDENDNVVDERDPLYYRTVFSGKMISNTGVVGNTYHVITFTENLYDFDEFTYTDKSLENVCVAEADRVVVDGIFITDGYANSPEIEDRIGAGAVVPGYAHVRNCVVYNNEASLYGGGLYLKPGALVSGTIVKLNTAAIGGGIYVEQPEVAAQDTARILTSTIADNHATTRAGGLWFETAVRVNSSAFWGNTSSDYANVAGQFSPSGNNYPLVFCGVEYRKVEGYGNIELSSRSTEGVRWDEMDPFNVHQYYPIVMSSTLARAGMTYSSYRDLMQQYPTLDSIDIAGISRVQWSESGVDRPNVWGDTLTIKNNSFIEIGARALNATFEIVVDVARVMYRIFVVHTDFLNTDIAYALQNNPDLNLPDNNANHQKIENALMYMQMGSSMLNPFHRLTDALDYIIKVRKDDPEHYRNARFEIFVEKGSYYSHKNVYGEEDQSRTNTFYVPEGVTIIGGVEHTAEGRHYCQAGYLNPYQAIDRIGGTANIVFDRLVVNGNTTTVTLNNELTDDIRSNRPMMDYNQNNIIEPWEFQQQTILDGETQHNDKTINSYHVITCFADPNQLGELPYKYKEYDPATHTFSDRITDKAFFPLECSESKNARSVVFDGLVIKGGKANNLEYEDAAKHEYSKKTYFRGGGIMVDGNWTEDFNDPNNPFIPNVTDPAPHNIPLIISNCQFKENSAANGGGIYTNGEIHIFSSHFVQNLSQGPMTQYDAQFIPWSAGGAMAINEHCGVNNCLFENNEAMRGNYPITVSGEEEIPDADVRQGFAGVLSASQSSEVRAFNCDFVRNKAVAYPAIYNFMPNNGYANSDERHFAFNSIFWGNEATGIPNNAQNVLPQTRTTFNQKYDKHKIDVAHIDSTLYDKYQAWFDYYKTCKGAEVAAQIPEEVFGIPDFKSQIRASVVNPTDKNVIEAVTHAALDSVRAAADLAHMLFFCSFDEGMVDPATPFIDYLTQPGEPTDVDYRAAPIPKKINALGEEYFNFEALFTYLHGDHNILLSKNNNAVNGPNFVNPSLTAGVDGRMDVSDWILSRVNSLTDAGWGYLRQRAFRDVDHYQLDDPAEQTLSPDLWTTITVEQYNALTDDQKLRWFPVYNLEEAEFLNEKSEAVYNFFSNRHENIYHYPYMPVKDQRYMYYTRQGEASQKEMKRISPNPRLEIDSVYIDMGVYEYQYVQIKLPGNEIDTMWITTMENPLVNADGTTYEKATSDIYTALYQLLRSHNNHDKYLCFIEGDYAPSKLIDNRQAFVISIPTDFNEILLPDFARTDTKYSVRSLTLLGGWSPISKREGRNPERYKTTFSMPDNHRPSTLNQMFIIDDMTRQTMKRTYRSNDLERETTVIPITFDGLTFQNAHSEYDPASNDIRERGGASIFYSAQRQHAIEDGKLITLENEPLYPTVEEVYPGVHAEVPKLTISNCIFQLNGNRNLDESKRPSAVRVEDGGGYTLVVNSLFHSNAGSPLHVTQPEDITLGSLSNTPNKAVIVNSTFALNDGHIMLENPQSQVHNSIIWKDDLLNDTLTQLAIGSQLWQKGEVAPQKEDSVTYNAIFGIDAELDAYHNDALVSDNSNVFYGPNFFSTIDNATTNAERQQRDFHLKPAVLTMNMADTVTYRNLVFGMQTLRETPPILYWTRQNGIKHDITTLRNDSDLAYKPRLWGVGMERGAYECQAILQRVLYVHHTTKPEIEGVVNDGSSWIKSISRDKLQDAIDVAAMYTYLNRSAADEETRKSYVFVKGSLNQQDNPGITMHDGVQLYGSLPTNFSDTAAIIDNQYTDAECIKFTNYVIGKRPGMASPSTARTALNEIRFDTSSGTFNTSVLVDGVQVSNSGVTLTASPLNITDPKIILRNSIISDNNVDGLPVINLTSGLIYNSLLYGNSAPAQISVSNNGLVLNTTVIADDSGTAAIDNTNADAKSIVNTITLNLADSTLAVTEGASLVRHNTLTGMFAPYLNTSNAYSLPSYLTVNRPLHYQLHENSVAINAGLETSYFGVADSIANCSLVNPRFAQYTKYIDFTSDRDILGNPRRLGTVDLGTFETWKLENTTQHATNLTDDVNYTANFHGNLYPHQGSVLYLMNKSNLVVDLDDSDEPLFFGNEALRPAFTLVNPNASLYGQGNTIRLNYLATGHRFDNQQYALMGLPYVANVANNYSTSYQASNDGMREHLNPVPFSPYNYDGQQRSSYRYRFNDSQSECWKPLSGTVDASQGWLLDFGEQVTDTLIRFTAWGENNGDYVYTEEGDKTVTLTQYDNRTPGDNGSGLNFTRAEDMGWNLKGQPFLVANYNTAVPYSYTFSMDMPHLFYLMNGVTGLYSDELDPDQVITMQSWVNGSVIPLGAAYFTQTATLAETEPLLFRLPVFSSGLGHAPRRHQLVMQEVGGKGDLIEVIPDEEADKTINYITGRDGLKWTVSDKIPHLAMLNSTRTTPLSLLGAAPTETDIPLAVSVPKNENGARLFNFTLPDKDSYDDFEYVWLIDRALNRTTNLLSGDYTVNIEPGTDNNRFVLRFGGYPLTNDDNKRLYTVFAYDGMLNIRGLVNGDKISVFSATGKLLHKSTATQSEFSTPLYVTGNYVVRVNNTTHKVISNR